MGRVKKRDIVIPVRHQAYAPHLILTLRSIEKNFPHDKVWLAGFIPDWVTDKVHRIPVNQTGSSYKNVLMIMSEVANHPEVSEDFWFFNDDFYTVRKVTNPPVWHEGTLEDRAKRLRGVALGEYTRGATITHELLVKAGFENPLNFDLHVPMPMNKTGIDDAIGFVWRSGQTFWPHLRSIYGALTGLESVPGHDAKITTGIAGIPDGALYVSSSQRSLNGQLGRELKDLFPVPSAFEKAARKR